MALCTYTTLRCLRALELGRAAIRYCFRLQRGTGLHSETIGLHGKRIVVVEDDYLLARDICHDLQGFGATVLGPAPTPFYAMQLIGLKDRRNIDAAVLDIQLHGTSVYPVAETLQDRGVPFATAYAQTNLPQRFSEVPLLQKPYPAARLAQELHALLRLRLHQPILPQPEPATREAPAVHFARALARSWTA